MSNVGAWQAQSNVEPVSTATIGGIANIANYAVLDGCAPTYSAANLNVTVGSGSILYDGVYVAVTGAAVALVADPTNPRWSWVGINSSGTPTLVSGTAAATPSVPDVGNMVPVTLVYVQAALTIADNATYKLDKRVISPGPAIIRKSADETVNNSSTLQSDDAFLFTVAASTDYYVKAYLLLSTNTTADFKFAWTLTNATWDGTYQSAITPTATIDTTGTATGITSGTSKTVNITTNNATSQLWVATFVIHGGATGGALNFQWAQNTADVSDTKVLKNSWMEWRKLGAS